MTVQHAGSEYLNIGETWYRVTAGPVVRLQKGDGTEYQVVRDPDTHRPICDCPAATYRPERGECKHLKRLRELGRI